MRTGYAHLPLHGDRAKIDRAEKVRAFRRLSTFSSPTMTPS